MQRSTPSSDVLGGHRELDERVRLRVRRVLDRRARAGCAEHRVDEDPAVARVEQQRRVANELNSHAARPSSTQPLWPPRPIAFESATSTCVSPRVVRDVVEVALRVGLAVVDRRRQHPVAQREHAHDRLDRAGRSERVAHHRLRRRDGELVGVVAEDVLDRLRLGGVAERGGGAVRVDVADALGLDAGALERAAHHRRDARRLGLGLREVVRVVRGAVAEHLGVDRRRRARSACSQSSSSERAGALRHDEAGARRVERPRRVRRVLVLGREPAHRGEAARGSAGTMHASVPPASTASASPRLIISAASPIACEPVAQAETTA